MSLEKQIEKWIQEQMMFGDSVSSTEMALEIIFGKSSDVNAEEVKSDKDLLLAECSEMTDIPNCLNKHRGEWLFEKTEFWQRLYA